MGKGNSLENMTNHGVVKFIHEEIRSSMGKGNSLENMTNLGEVRTSIGK